MQSCGVFDQFNQDPQKFIKGNNFANFLNPNVELRMTEGKGRGVFAKNRIKNRDLISAERAIATGTTADRTKKLVDLAQLKGIHALRLS